jgi:hypothetical protein
MDSMLDELKRSLIIRGSVGSGGQNRRPDVELVQSLLNDWRSNCRKSPIAVDGIVGPQTIGAIVDFQKAEVGLSDGRCDPRGPTIGKLARRHFESLVKSIKIDSFNSVVRRDQHSNRQASAGLSGEDLKKQLNEYWAVVRKER